MTDPIRVLIVDDTPDIRMLLRVALGSLEGFEPVGEAEDGAQAVELVASLKPDAVLLDLAMPVMDGLQATPEIRRVSPDTRVIILSGFSKDRLGAEALGVGADAYIEKGTSPKAIAEIVRDVCSRPRPDDDGSRSPPDPATDGPEAESDRDGHEPWRRRIALAVEQVSELAGAFASFGRVVRSRISFDRAGYALSQRDGFRIAAVCGPEHEAQTEAGVGALVPFPTDVNAALDLGTTVTVDDTRSADAPLNVFLLHRGIRSYTAVPVRAAGRAQAVVSFASARPSAFPKTDVDYLESAVREAAAAFHMLWSMGRDEKPAPGDDQAVEAMREWNRIVRHDLRSPLTVISGFTETMRSAWTELPDEKKLDFVDAIARGAEAMTTLLSDMEHVDRLESGVGSVNAEPIRLCALIAETTKDLKLGRDRVVNVSIAEDLPLALADANDQRRVLANLLENAFKFSSSNEPVEVEVFADASMINVRITDHGIGIPLEEQEGVFDKFSRASQHNDGPQVPGSGLGLYICRSIVEAHGGRISLRSEPGIGTTVEYTIPAVAAAA